MAQGSGIEWTESTWNPVTGCNKISPGCKHCYAERMAERLQAMGQPNYRDGFALTLQPQMLELPLRWSRPQTIFVNSMSDLFHEAVPLAYIQRVFDVMRWAHWHRFQVLTKRAERLAALERRAHVAHERVDGRERQERRLRPPHQRPSAHRRPCEVPVCSSRCWGRSTRSNSQTSTGSSWAVSLGHARAPSTPRGDDLRDQCRRAGVAFFFKQWGGKNKKKAGRLLEGRTWTSCLRCARRQVGARRPRRERCPWRAECALGRYTRNSDQPARTPRARPSRTVEADYQCSGPQPGHQRSRPRRRG
jgi:protein gp37